MSAKAVIGSIIGSVAIMSAMMFFVMPMLFPVLQNGTMVVQTKYEEFRSASWIYDSQLAWKQMTDTEMSITVKQNSKLSVAFDAMAMLHVDSSFTIKVSYNVSLRVEGVKNRTIRVFYFDTETAGETRELTYNLHIHLVTDALDAGTYTISVYWISQTDATGTNSLSVCHDPAPYNFTRSLFAQELREL